MNKKGMAGQQDKPKGPCRLLGRSKLCMPDYLEKSFVKPGFFTVIVQLLQNNLGGFDDAMVAEEGLEPPTRGL